MTGPTEKDLLQSADRLLRQSERELDELTAAKLRAARLRALETRPRHGLLWRLTGGFAAAGLALGLAAVMWFQAPSDTAAPRASEAAVADLDLLTTESPDFYSELEFYRWLAGDSDAS